MTCATRLIGQRTEATGEVVARITDDAVSVCPLVGLRRGCRSVSPAELMVSATP
jgi:hypothetical protein